MTRFTRGFVTATVCSLGVAVLSTSSAFAQFFPDTASPYRGVGVGAATGTNGSPYVGPQNMPVTPAGTLSPYVGSAGSIANTAIASPYAVNPNASSPAYSPYLPYIDPFGGYLRGAADVMNAQGRYLMDRQRALIMREGYKQARVETRRRIFEEYLYEREQMPTPEEIRQQNQRELLSQSLRNPPDNEVLSARALNSVLASLENNLGNGGTTEPIPLDQETLRKVNVTKAGSQGNLGVLRDEGKLNWPVAIQDLAPADEVAELRRHLDADAQEAYSQATTRGKVDPNLLQKMENSVRTLNDLLARNVNSLSFTQYSEAKSFLKNLDAAVNMLAAPDAGEFLAGRNIARGATVQELVENMASKGLRFAPATRDANTAYFTLH